MGSESPESPETPTAPGIPPLNFIYACSICCATFADVYKGPRETVLGLSDGIHTKDRLVSKLFLASCCHVFCSSHLEGGGPPFHPAGQRPQAPCPVCVKEKEDGELRELYSLRGLHKDECDPAIPAAWFVAPPMRLDGNSKEMEALRFQYVALIRYCQNTYTSRKPLHDELDKTQKELKSMQDLASAERAKILELRQENERLRASQQQLENFQSPKEEAKRLHELEQKVEQYRRIEIDLRDFETFKQNKSAIKHYMKLVPMLIEQNEKMKDRLTKLGFAMALEPIPNFPGRLYSENNSQHDKSPNKAGVLLRKISSSHTAGRSESAASNGEAAPLSPFNRRPLKRQRLDSPLPRNMQNQTPSSRDAMPPPPKPMSRMRSMRKILPTLRKKFSHDTSPMSAPNNIDSDVRMYDNGHWQQVSAFPVTNDTESSTRHSPRTDAPYMSGALPVEHSSQIADPRMAQLVSSMGSNDADLGFSFRSSSPFGMNDTSTDRAAQLSTEPSYIRLMDGLSRDNGLELGLKDPRNATSKIRRPSGTNEHDVCTYQDQRQSNVDIQKPWGLGHPFLHQSRSGTPSSSPYMGLPQIHQASGHLNRVNHTPILNHITPLSPPNQQSSHKNQNVVSPFFKNNQQLASACSKSRIAEPQDSSSHFDAYRSPRRLTNGVDTRKHDQRGLDRVSFFDSPYKLAHQPYRQTTEQGSAESSPHPSYYPGRNVDSQGFITRPETGRSLYLGDSTYASSLNRRSVLQQQQLKPHAVIPFPPTNRSSHSRIGQLPSLMPSTMTGRSPIRSRQQWEALQHFGVRSSRKNYTSFTRNTAPNSSNHLHSSSGRYSVRR